MTIDSDDEHSKVVKPTKSKMSAQIRSADDDDFQLSQSVVLTTTEGGVKRLKEGSTSMWNFSSSLTTDKHTKTEQESDEELAGDERAPFKIPI